MDTTHRLSLPYLAAAQAQKHVTHNEALRVLDVLVQTAVASRTLATPPASPVDGTAYVVAAGGQGAWSGHDGSIAARQDGAWIFYAPVTGHRVWVADEAALLVWDGAAWQPAGGAMTPPTSLPQLGVNTTADATNRLAVKSDAVLFTHDDVTPGTGDMRQVLNKSAAAKTVSQLYQSNWSGRAETGLTGDDDWRVKVSPDGSVWFDAIITTRSSGRVTLQNGATVNGSARFNGAFGVGREGSAAGGIYFNRDPDNPFLLFSAGPSATPTDIGQFRANLAAEVIGVTDKTGGVYGLAYKTTAGDRRVGILTSLPLHAFDVTGVCAPHTDNAYTLGTSAYRWSVVYAATGTINTSDARDKIVEARIGGAGAGRIVDAVEPVSFKWRVGGTDVVEVGTNRVLDGHAEDGAEIWRDEPVYEERQKPGTRKHLGWLAQEVKAALDAEGMDCGAWGLDDKTDPDSRQWVRPDQLVALLWAALRETRAEVAQLRAEPGSAKSKVAGDVGV